LPGSKAIGSANTPARPSATTAWAVDYLAALLWGSIGTQGIKSVAGLVQYKWPGAS
jgi:hypothetical protein